MSAAVQLTADASKTLPPHGPHRPPDPLACEYSVTGALLDGSAVINFANVSVSSDITDMTDDPQPSAAVVPSAPAVGFTDLKVTLTACLEADQTDSGAERPAMREPCPHRHSGDTAAERLRARLQVDSSHTK